MPGCYQLGTGTVVRFQGKDRCRIFNNLCTQDLRTLKSGQSLETYVTDGKGRTFGHGIAFGMEDESYFVSVPNQADKLVPHFDRYVIREDAMITDQSLAFELWLFGDRLSAARGFNIDVSGVPEAQAASIVGIDGGGTVFLIHAPWIGSDSVLALVPAEADRSHVQTRMGSDWIESDLDRRFDWEWLRIRAAWPWYGVDMDDRNLPQEIGRDNLAISFNKGCYLGQETIARLDALGQVQKKLVRLNIDSAKVPVHQTNVESEGKEVGKICSAALDVASGQCIALAYIKRSHFQSGQRLNVGDAPAVVL
jgi:tRNA-modifying protein YgfZ